MSKKAKKTFRKPKERMLQKSEPQSAGYKGNRVLFYLVIFLLLFSAVQTFQITEIKKNIEEKGVSVFAGGSAAQNIGVRARQAPSMVGGC